MGSTRPRRPPAPSAAERARSIAARGGQASLVGTGVPQAVPLVHHVRADGSAVLLFDDHEPVLQEIRRAPGGEFAAMLEIADHAPVELREPVRGLLWITGRLRVPEPDIARRIAVQVADVRPHEDLLRLGHGATLVRLDPGSAVLSDAEGTAALTPVDLAAAWPDPFCRYESHWLAHLEKSHPDVLDALVRHLPPALRELRDARLRPLGMDRFGLRLRLEAPGRDHDVRIAWPQQANSVEELRKQMQHLIGCPMRRGVDVDPLGGSGIR
ncbi:MAG TPA: DUF2470 domain-containing protein [Pseudonocardia sp.]|uniref:DUF2470 domain-containing protein n=1 Tax=Pseudonocardia sp. TaxID=60912 RepID=UPI002B4B3657|nr:DUF2470 domain-containing protein [Pseudonocardia sp.]HLU57607.1 DUF2470 domain-containing protein [Pseudonocardia sp.]